MNGSRKTRWGSPALVCGLWLFTAGCCGSGVSVLDAAFDVEPGTTRLLSAKVAGLRTARWEIVSASPESCRGSIDPPKLGEVEAVFRAPRACDTEGAVNNLRLTAELDCGSPQALPLLVRIRRAGPAPEYAGSARPPDAGAPQDRSVGGDVKHILPQFGGEVFFVFNDGPSGFRTFHKRLPDGLSITLESPQQAGFGGVCISSSDVRPLDVTGFSTLEIDMETNTPQHILDIKLEQQDSSVYEGQFNLNSQALRTAGRQLVRLPLDDAPASLRKAVRRVCFAMNTVGFRGTPLRNDVLVHQVRFVK